MRIQVVFSTLFLHHLSEDDAVSFLRRMADNARRLVVVLDLERTRLGYLLAYAGVRVLTTSDVARFDVATHDLENQWSIATPYDSRDQKSFAVGKPHKMFQRQTIRVAKWDVQECLGACPLITDDG